MINKKLLYTIFNPNKYIYHPSDNDRLILQIINKNIYIFILNDKRFNYIKTNNNLNNLLIRKNSIVVKDNNSISIIFNTNYIKYILRQKTINTLLNE